MTGHNTSRRSFVKDSVAVGAAALLEGTLHAQPKGADGPLLAYVGTFSSPLRDTLPTRSICRRATAAAFTFLR